MEKILTNQEIHEDEAIKDLNKEKGRGPDGISNEFYIHFKHEFGPILESVTRNVYSSKEIPKEMTKSYICWL